MKILAIFILGFSFHYIIHAIELLSRLLEAKVSLKMTKINSEIGEWSTYESQNDPYQHGYMYSSVDLHEIDEWEDDDD